MPKIVEFLRTIFPKNSSTLQTDAAPVSIQDDTSDYESNGNSVTPLSSADLQFSSTNVSETPSSESLSPIKQHVLAELTTQPNHQIIERNENNSVSGFDNNSNGAPVLNATSIHNTQAQNVFQISNANGIHIGNSFLINGISANSSLPQNHTTPDRRAKSESSNRSGLLKTKTIEKMMKCQDTLEHREIDLISTHLLQWREIARKLGFSEGEIEHFYLDNHMNGTKEVC